MTSDNLISKEEHIVGCWHHGDMNRLRTCLSSGYCDLHPLKKTCPKGRMSAEYWYNSKMKLKIGDEVRFCVEKRKVVATGEVCSIPYDIFTQKRIRPVDPCWPSAVDISKVVWLDGGYCPSHPVIGSHRLDK